jgi:threonine dehydratase
MVRKEETIVEGAGAAGIAAVLAGTLKTAIAGQRVAIVVSGGNIDRAKLEQIV